MPSSSSATCSEPIGVLVADSNHIQCQLLVRALRRRPDFRVQACEVETEAMLQAVDSSGAQVVLLNTDHGHGGWQDMTVVRRLHLAHPEVAKVLLLESCDRDAVVNAFRSGAKGVFAFSDHPFRLLCKCIQSVHKGQIWASSEQLHYLIDVVTQVPSLRVVNSHGSKLLTPREEQVVALVADGLTNRDVALELRLSEHTVKKYLYRIFDKLGISSRVELVLYAVNHGERLEAEWIAGAPSLESSSPPQKSI
jgi:DNA-binding NarL/FixJ family response regulator